MKLSRFAWAAALLVIGTLAGQNGFAHAEETTAEDAAAATPEEVTTEPYVPPENAEEVKFEAEVHRMLDIVVNSLYQNKDVFLRELISNASDALDKIRFLALTQPDLMADKEELEVRIEYDEDAKTLTVRDSGIGMTKEDLVKNLGTVARSGTTKFLDAFKSKDEGASDMGGLIGQFGVGFYSTFLVADRVTVASRNPKDGTQHVWESVNGEDTFHIYEDPRGNTLGRGTEITLHLKDDAYEYSQADRLKNLVTHYSEFITHPIFIRTTTTTTVEVDDDEAETEEPVDDEEKQEETDGEDDIKVEDEEKEEKPKKTEEITTHSWDEININPAIWTREKDSITDDEYKSFWKVLAKEEESECERWSHFNAEGNINFRSILYLPQDIPAGYKFGNVDAVDGGMKLYVRKVLISDDFNLLPRYLGFMRGVVDSDDLPLNVNRETLQESKIIKIIRKKLVRKAIDLIKGFSKEDPPTTEDEEVEAELDEEGNVIESEPVKTEAAHPYIDWYKKFSNNIKMGVIDDDSNRGKLSKLLRFQTSKSDDEYISLDEYIENMKEWQTEIFVFAGSNIEEMKKSPFLEEFNSKDVEVVLMTEAVDEYMIQNLRDYDGKKFKAITSENVKLQEDDEDLAKRREKAYKNKFKPLTKYLKKLYGPAVMRIQVSKRLGSNPAIVSNSEYGHSANMERIMRAQAYQWGQDEFSMKAMKIMEINPRHPFVTKLLAGIPDEDSEGDDAAKVTPEVENAAWLLFDMASLNGGFPITDTLAHSKRLSSFLKSSLGVESMSLEDEIDPPEEEEEAPDMGDVDLDSLNMEDFDLDGIDLD